MTKVTRDDRELVVKGQPYGVVQIHGNTLGVWSNGLPHAPDEVLQALARLANSIGVEDEYQAAARPRIVCLCGSTRFIETFAVKTWELEREGVIVLGCTLLPAWYCDVPDHFGERTGTKAQCDELHLRKIDLADEVLVLNVGGYIGDSTRNEIEHAIKTGKPVRYLEPAARNHPAEGGEES